MKYEANIYHSSFVKMTKIATYPLRSWRIICKVGITKYLSSYCSGRRKSLAIFLRIRQKKGSSSVRSFNFMKQFCSSWLRCTASKAKLDESISSPQKLDLFLWCTLQQFENWTRKGLVWLGFGSHTSWQSIHNVYSRCIHLYTFTHFSSLVRSELLM